MYIVINRESPIVEIDHSYSNEQENKILIVFKNKKAMDVNPSFLELLSMMNGLFEKKDIIDYATRVHCCSKDYIEDYMERMFSWDLISYSNNRLLWGTPFDKEYYNDSFSRFNVRFLNATPTLISLALLLCKYGFYSIKFQDADVRISAKDVEASLLLQTSDIGCLLCDKIMQRQMNHSVIQTEKKNKERERLTLLIVDGYVEGIDDVDDESEILIDAKQYRRELNICRDFGFRFINNNCFDKQSDFAYTLNIENDIVFGVINGFYP